MRPPKLTDFVDSVARRSELSPSEARHLSEAVLAVLRERVHRGEARAIAQQLPKPLQDSMDGGHGATFDAEEFVRRVSQRATVTEAHARSGSVAVIGALRDVIDETTMAYVRAQLTEDYATLLAPSSPEAGRLRPV